MATVIAKDLTKIYDNHKVAVDAINFEVFEGEVFGFLGPNGAGKSTTISMITGIRKPTAGTLLVLDHTMPREHRKVQQQLGYVPQELVFYDHLTVGENLSLFATSYNLKNREERIQYATDLMGLDEISDQIADQLSGGQKRRLNVAMGLLHEPKLLVLDEPSAGMDPQSRAMLWQSIERLSNENITILLTTHLMETADRLSDRICIIDHGKIAAIDTPQELKKRIGEGDIIEISLVETVTDESYQSIKTTLINTFGEKFVSNIDHSLTITTLDGVNALSTILPIINSTIGRHQVKNISLRDNTLEDVFISITGNQLRERQEVIA